MDSITETELEKLIVELIEDRDQIARLNPDLGRRDSLLWMLLGMLVSLLNVPLSEQAAVYDPAASDPYYSAVIRVLQDRADPPFDAVSLLSRLESM
jgi:hypothetical protein